MESSYIKPSFKRSMHVGCNEYSKVGMDSLHQTWNDAQKLSDLCELNDFDKTYLITEKKVTYKVLHARVIETLNKLISQAEGAAESKAPQYTFNFITFSCHGVMSETQQTMAVIPFTEDGENYCKQYINITSYAQKLAELRNNYTVILFDGCRNEVTAQSLDKEKGTGAAKTKENCLSAQKAYYGQKYEGLTIVIFSSLKGAFAREEVDGGCGTKKFLSIIKENIGDGLLSWEFIESYENQYIEKVTMMRPKDIKKIIMFSKDKNSSQQEENKTSVKDKDSTNKTIDSTKDNDAKKQSFERDMKVLEKLNDQKQLLLQQLKTKGFDSFLICQFLNTIMCSVKFSDPNDEVEANSVVKSALLKLTSENYAVLVDQVFIWIYTHMDKAKGLDQSLAIANKLDSLIVHEDLPQASSRKQIYSDPSQVKKTGEFNDKGEFNGNGEDFNWTVIKATNGKVIQGGADKNLYVLGSDLKHQETINLSHQLYSGMAIGKRLFCAQGDSKVTMFDEDTLELIDTIDTQQYARTMLLIHDDYLLIGQYDGYIDIIQLSTLSTIFKHQLSQKEDIFHAIKTSNPNEYALALQSQGIVIVNIQKGADNKFSLIENTSESYFNDKTVWQIAEVQSNILIACVREMNDLQVIDRRSKQVVRTISDASTDSSYNCLQKVIGYDDQTFPYLLLRDQYKISLINAKTFTAVDIIQSQYENFCLPYSMVQYQVKNELRLLALHHNDETNERRTKEFVIGSL